MNAQSVTITKSEGWLESAFVEWTPIEGVKTYHVYYSGEGITDQIIDNELIRSYGNYFRADILGLVAGDYTLKVVPVTNNIEGEAVTSIPLKVLAHNRTGFAHHNERNPGAYKFDGSLKDNAVVLYITQNTKNTVSLTVASANSNPCVGLQAILDGFKKGKDNRPLVIRLVGTITDLDYMLNGDIVIENKNNIASYITFEGVGNDAVANGWGLRIKNASNVEVRNLGFMLTDADEGDNVGLQQGNDHIWVHNCDMFYGAAGGDADQSKGDGALDCKGSTFVTFSYNHFWDSGKCNLLGLSEDTTEGLYITYHHNWYDHSDSRHPRVRFYSAHVYNNYYDGNSKYGAGSTEGSSIFMEGNFFRKCKYPMLTSMQGSDVFNGSLGTFSKEDGGTIKAYNNTMSGQTRFVPYDAVNYPVEFDAYVAGIRSEAVPNNITSKQGDKTYNNFDTDPNFYIANLKIQEPEVAKDDVMLYAGRVSGGDLKWTFNDAVDDISYAVNTALMSKLTSYKTSLVFVQGEVAVAESTQILNVPDNHDQVVAEDTAIETIVFSWDGTASDVDVIGLPASGIDFVKDIDTKTVTITGIPTANVSFSVATVGTVGTSVMGSGNISILGIPAGDQIHNFTTSGLNSTFYTFTGAKMHAQNGTATYDGLELKARLKIESATIITYTTASVSTLTLVFEPDFTGTVKLNGKSYSANSAGVVIIPAVPAGLNTISKGTSTNLYYIKTEFNLGVKNNSNTLKLSLYPNPVSDVLHVAASNSSVVNKVMVFNLLGQLVKSEQNNVKNIDVSNLRSGSYLVKIHTDNGVFDQKIIKK